MNDVSTLLAYRRTQAEETLADAQRSFESGASPRSVINRAYYAMFYSVLAVMIASRISVKTSRHSGLISLFDRELVHAGKVDKKYSEMLHDVFDQRIEGDYRELAEMTREDAEAALAQAKDFLGEMKRLLGPL